MNDAKKVLGITCLWVGLVLSGCDKPAPAPAPKPPPVAPPPPAPVAKAPPAVKEPPPAVKVVAKDLPLPADIVQFKAEIGKATAQIDLVVSKLDVLAASTNDLEKPYGEFSDALKALDTETQGVRKRADDMRARGAAYFEDWEKRLAAMTTPEVKDVAVKRRAELSKKYAEVLTAMQETRAAYDPFAAGLQSIATTLDDDLSAESLRAIAPQVAKTKEGVKTLKDRAALTLQKLNDVGAIYSQP